MISINWWLINRRKDCPYYAYGVDGDGDLDYVYCSHLDNDHGPCNGELCPTGHLEEEDA